MEITVRNFKALEEEYTISTNLITVVTGHNSSGKSSISQAIRLLKENVFNDANKQFKSLVLGSLEKLNLDKVQLGKFKYVLNRHNNGKDDCIYYSFIIQDYNNFFIANNGKFQVDLVYSEDPENENGAILTRFSISLILKDEIVELVSLRVSSKLRLQELFNFDIYVNYNFFINYFMKIEEGVKLKEFYDNELKTILKGFDPSFNGINKFKHPESICRFEGLFPNYPNAVKIEDVFDVEYGKYSIVTENGEFGFTCNDNAIQNKVVLLKGYNTIDKYPLVEFLEDKENKFIGELISKEDAQSLEISEEFYDYISFKRKDELLMEFQIKEKEVLSLILKESFSNSMGIFKMRLQVGIHDLSVLNNKHPLSQYIFKVLNQNNNISSQFVYKTRNKEQGNLDNFLSYIQKLISTATSYLLVELSNFDYFNGVSIEVKREYTDLDFPTVQLFNQAKDFLKGKAPRAFFLKWLKEFKIGDDFRIEKSEFGGSVYALLKKENEWVNLATEGTGKVKLLFLLLKITTCFYNKYNKAPDFSFDDLEQVNYGVSIPKMLIVEEPEAFLHPNFQSKLSDLFIDAAGLNDNLEDSNANISTAFLIETHSEYLIRNLQLNVAKRNNLSRIISVFYFGYNGVWEIKIDKNGQLSRPFGKGFIDEADRIAEELFFYKHTRNINQN